MSAAAAVDLKDAGSVSSALDAAKQGGESLYMDVEETELLHRFAVDNPNMVTFKETDDRIRTLEERFPESELEKLMVRANQLMTKRREALLGDDKVQTLPSHPVIPTMLQLRELRNELIAQNTQFATHEPFVSLADVLSKEVALSEESRASLPYALVTLVQFFQGEVRRLPRKLLRYMERFEMLNYRDTEAAITLRSAVQDRLSNLEEQIVFVRQAWNAVKTYSELHQSEQRISAGRTQTETTDDHRHAAQASTARLAEDLHPLYFRYYIADQTFQYRVTRKIERFVSRGQLLPQLKRYEWYATVMAHLAGGQPAVGADAASSVPLLSKQETVISDQLDHLCSCFRIPQLESAADLQQFAYHVNRKYHLVFHAQNEEWHFSEDAPSRLEHASTDSRIGSKDHHGSGNTAKSASSSSAAAVAGGGSGTSAPAGTVLRASGWATSKETIDPPLPGPAAKQELRLEQVSLASEGGRQVQAELEFLKETHYQQSLDRWKQRTEALHKKLQHRKLLAAVMHQDEGESQAGDMTAVSKLISANSLLQKYLSVQQLRYVRTREFRRKLLDTLNYFASVLRMIAQDVTVTKTLAHNSTGIAGVQILPILSDASVERERDLLGGTIRGVDAMASVDCDTFATQLLRLYDGVFLDGDIEEHGGSAAAGSASTGTNANTSSSGGKRDKKESAGDQKPSTEEGMVHGLGNGALGSGQMRADLVDLVDGKLTVKRSSDQASVMDQWALEELQRLELWMTRVATYYVDKFNEDTYPSDQDAKKVTSPARSTSPTLPGGESTTIDYAIVVEDMLESESWFSEGKMKVLNGYREAYEQTTDPKQLHDLATVMKQIIAQRPTLDFGDSYFTSSYTREVVNLEIHHSLLREIVQAQITDERKIMSTAAPLLQTAASSGDLGAKAARSNSVSQSAATANASSAATSATTTKAGSSAASAASHNIASTLGHRVKPGDTAEFPGAFQRSFHKPRGDPKRFGRPDPCINDPRVYYSPFPGASVTNSLDIYTSLGHLAYIPALIDRCCSQLAERFGFSNFPSAMQVLRREVLQELLVQWRLLGEEEKIGRQMQQPSTNATTVADLDTDAVQGGLTSVMHDIGKIDQIVDELLAEDDVGARKRGMLSDASKGPVAAASLADVTPGPAGNSGLGSARLIPNLSPRVVHYIAVMEVLHIRSAILSALFETELLYGLHRRQGKIMGLSVKKTQLGPIDFETRRTFAEVDDLEAFKDTSNPLEEILSIKTEMMSSLSIGEFDAQMACFDLTTYDGARRLVSHQHVDFRKALTVQICTKNMLIAVTSCNMVALDVYFENVNRQMYERMSKQAANQKYHTPTTANPVTRCRLKSWIGVTGLVDHSVVDASSGTPTTLERAQLVKYFVSVNNIKSVFRKHILNEMNSRTVDIMSSKKPETLRKVLRELKGALVREYCLAVTMATYQLAIKYQCCALSLHLRGIVMRHPELNAFVLGSASDVIRPAPRGLASVGESRRAATCMIARNGRIDEPRYIPNVLQLLAADYQSKDGARAPASQGQNSQAAAGAASSQPSNTPGSCVVLPNLAAGVSYLRTNTLLSLTGRMLYHWIAVSKLLFTLATVSPSSIRSSSGSSASTGDDVGSAGAKATAVVDLWKSEMAVVMNEIESLRDPNDTISVVEYLEGKHSILYLKLVAALCNAKSFADRYQHKATGKKLRKLLDVMDDASRFTTNYRTRFPRMMYPQVALYDKACEQLSADEKLKFSPYYAPICSVKKLLDGGSSIIADIDQSLQDIENVAAATLPLHRDEETFYSEVENNNFAYIGDEVGIPLSVLDWMLQSLSSEQKNLVGAEVYKIDRMVEDTRDETESLMPVTLAKVGDPRSAKKISAIASASTAPILAHFEFIMYTTRRDRLRETLLSLTAASMRSGWQRQTKAQKAATATNSATESDLSKMRAGDAQSVSMLDDLYARTIIARGRIVCEKEAADKNDVRFRRKAKGNEKEVVRRQYQLSVMEINKLLIMKYRAELEVVVKQLEEEAALREQLNALPEQSGTALAGATSTAMMSFKTSLFSDFCRIIMSRAMCTRPDGEKMATFHVPESSLALAIDTVGTRLATWHTERLLSVSNVAEQILRSLQTKVIQLERKLEHEQYQREIDGKAVERRTAAAIADKKYELLYANGVLEKRLGAALEQLSTVETTLRESVRVEYQERIANLESELLLSEQRFQAFKKKTFRDVQASLEEVKRGAMLAVGKMENAPLHMKRQALRIAISDDELNTIKEQNAELKQAILKTKIWYEIKAMRMKASFEKRLKDATQSMEESRATFWDNREATEKEMKQLKAQLSTVQYQLSQAEIEIEMLRKDLQVQLSNKKDLVSWKLQNAKAVEELQAKLRKFEKWSAYDMDKIVAEYEKRHATATATADEDKTNPSPARHGTSAGSQQRQHQHPHGSSTGGVSSEEHKRLCEKLEREKRLKEQAFAKIDELRTAEAGNTEALVWQRKYFEAANELQRSIRELEATRAFLAANGLTLPAGQGAPGAAAASATHGNSSAASSHPASATQHHPRANSSSANRSNGGATPPVASAYPSFELRPSTSAPAVRPPPPASAGGHRPSEQPPRQVVSATTVPAASRLKK